MFLLPEYSPICQNLTCFLGLLLLKWPVSHETFYDLFSAQSMVPSFLCHIFPAFHTSNYFSASIIPSYVVRKEALLYFDTLLSW